MDRQLDRQLCLVTRQIFGQGPLFHRTGDLDAGADECAPQDLAGEGTAVGRSPPIRDPAPGRNPSGDGDPPVHAAVFGLHQLGIDAELDGLPLLLARDRLGIDHQFEQVALGHARSGDDLDDRRLTGALGAAHLERDPGVGQAIAFATAAAHTSDAGILAEADVDRAIDPAHARLVHGRRQLAHVAGIQGGIPAALEKDVVGDHALDAIDSYRRRTEHAGRVAVFWTEHCEGGAGGDELDVGRRIERFVFVDRVQRLAGVGIDGVDRRGAAPELLACPDRLQLFRQLGSRGQFCLCEMVLGVGVAAIEDRGVSPVTRLGFGDDRAIGRMAIRVFRGGFRSGTDRQQHQRRERHGDGRPIHVPCSNDSALATGRQNMRAMSQCCRQRR